MIVFKTSLVLVKRNNAIPYSFSLQVVVVRNGTPLVEVRETRAHCDVLTIGYTMSNV